MKSTRIGIPARSVDDATPRVSLGHVFPTPLSDSDLTGVIIEQNQKSFDVTDLETYTVVHHRLERLQLKHRCRHPGMARPPPFFYPIQVITFIHQPIAIIINAVASTSRAFPVAPATGSRAQLLIVFGIPLAG